MSVKTEQIMIQTLCVPCGCRCRYCLLSWDGKCIGASWERSKAFAMRFIGEVKNLAPDIGCSFSFGYSMEHPDLKEAIRFLRDIGSPQAEFLQCDGMRFRSEKECEELAAMLKGEGVRHLNFTVYGLSEYHDRFAGRKGDLDLIMRMIKAAANEGLEVSAGIPLSSENVAMAGEAAEMLEGLGASVRLFVPHEEGRGKSLADARLKEKDLEFLSGRLALLLNRSAYKTERDWLTEGLSEETKRTLIISLREDNIERYENMSAEALIQEAEDLDDAYYSAFPSFGELAEMYGDPEGEMLYSRRDLFYHYRKIYEKEYNVDIYDVTDERQSGSRRYT